MTTVSEIFETMAYGPAPESDKPALEWIARRNGAFGLFIGGRWGKGKNGPGLGGTNPAPTGRLARGTPARQGHPGGAPRAGREALRARGPLAGPAPRRPPCRPPRAR